MRVSDQQMVALLQFQMNATYENLAQAQTVLSTGRQINTPSDNPIGTAVALELQSNLGQNEAIAASNTNALSWMQTTDTALSGVSDVLVQARTLAVQGANDTLNASNRQALAASVGQLLQQAVQAANASNDGQYVLSGYQTGTVPFAVSGSGASVAVTYQGDGGALQREIAPGQTMQINTTGSTALPAVFSALIALQNDLSGNNSAAVGGVDLQALDQAHDGLLLAQTTVGSGINRLQAMQSNLDATHASMTTQLSTTVDADMAAAAVDFSTRQATYQATLSAAAKVVQPSLLEFLR